MKPIFSRNISAKGRVLRGLLAVLLLGAAAYAFTRSRWLGLLLAGSGAFVLFEAFRGWCALRACGIRTRW